MFNSYRTNRLTRELERARYMLDRLLQRQREAGADVTAELLLQVRAQQVEVERHIDALFAAALNPTNQNNIEEPKSMNPRVARRLREN